MSVKVVEKRFLIFLHVNKWNVLNIVLLFVVWYKIDTKRWTKLELYFFRNVSNYNELKEKTNNAYKIKSTNKRKVKIVKTIKLKGENENNYFENIKSDNKYVIKNLDLMKIEDGIWYCIELVINDKSIIVMADGYPYAKFAAIRFGNWLE